MEKYKQPEWDLILEMLSLQQCVGGLVLQACSNSCG